MKPVIVIPVRDRLDLTAPLVETLHDQGGYRDLLVYDNGSTDGTAAWLRDKGVTRIDAAGWGIHEMWNHGLGVAEKAESPAVILNNDLELDGKPGWVTRLCAPLDSGWAVVCPNYDGRISHRGIDPVHLVCGGRYDGTGGLAGFAFAMSPDVVRTYRFPEEPRWWFGDTDLVREMTKRNRHCGLVIDIGVTHLDGGSQTAKDHISDEQCRADMEWFENKWGAACVTE